MKETGVFTGRTFGRVAIFLADLSKKFRVWGDSARSRFSVAACYRRIAVIIWPGLCGIQQVSHGSIC